MSEHAPMDGPEFLDQYAGRMESNGMHIEAALFRTYSNRWSQDRQGLSPAEPPSTRPVRPEGRAFNAFLVEADPAKNLLMLRTEGSDFRVSGRYHLIPVGAVS